MFVLKLELLKIISIWLDKQIRRMIAEIQVSGMPRETLKLEQVSDNIYTIHNVPFAYLQALQNHAEHVATLGLAYPNEQDFYDTLKHQLAPVIERTYEARL